MRKDIQKTLVFSALLSLLAGYLWVCCFVSHSFTDAGFFGAVPLGSWYPLLFTACFLLWVGFTLRGQTAAPEHWFWLACCVLLALAQGLKRELAVSFWGDAALHCFAGYWVLCRAGVLTQGESSFLLPLDLLDAFVLRPFGGLFLRLITLAGSAFRALRRLILRREDGKARWRSGLLTLVVILAAVPLFLLAGSLLSQAEPAFAELWNALGSIFICSWAIPVWMRDTLIRFLFGLPVGAYLFGLAGGCRKNDRPTIPGQPIRDALPGMRVIPEAGLIAVLSAFLVLYLLFFWVRARHLLGAFFGTVPGRLTASDYAREGFFQLAKVMVLNFVLLGAAALLSRTALPRHRILRAMGVGLMAQSLFLAVTAASKLLLYISRFGLTSLRLVSGWGILVLALGSVLAAVRLCRPFRAARLWIWASAAAFILLCFF